MGTKGCFPLVPFLNVDKVVCVPDVNLGDDFGLAMRVRVSSIRGRG